jgi:hypothetical protein
VKRFEDTLAGRLTDAVTPPAATVVSDDNT